MKLALGLLMVAVSARVAAQQPPPAPAAASVLQELRLEGATIFNRDDVLWLLHLREGGTLEKSAEEIAKALQERYEQDGYTEARVTGVLDAGRLTLTVDEGRIDDVEISGQFSRATKERFVQKIGVKPGDIYNKRTVGRAVSALERESQGAISADDAKLTHRNGRAVLVIPMNAHGNRSSVSFGSGREDLFSPVDGFNPSLAITTTVFDPAHFNHTYISFYGAYKVSSEKGAFAAGGERPFFGGARLFVGGDVHDLTTSDDLWRIEPMEQALVAVGFKNTFRDYYRRRGVQLFTVFRPGDNNEFTVMARWDRHQPLPNATDYSFFRDDTEFRPNPPVPDQHVNALVFGYTFDTRPLSGVGRDATFRRHLKDDLFGFSDRQRPGLRLEWTSEIAGHAMDGDTQFDRHVLNLRGYLGLTSHTMLTGRGLFGFSNGTLPPERQFALGGIGSVHGYKFKEQAGGTGMVLLNAEYRIDLLPHRENGLSPLGLFVFYDAGKINGASWLNGTGVGLGQGNLRIEFGFRANDIPNSRQILVRFTPTF
jgi:hypothetical protein